MRRRFKGSKFFLFFLLALAGLAVFTSIVLLLWNALLPALFHLPVIGFWQAAGLLILSKILFGGFRGGCGGFGGRWRHKMQQRWMDMSPEERERFKQEWGRHGGHFRGRGFEEGRSYGERQPREEGRSRGEGGVPSGE